MGDVEPLQLAECVDGGEEVRWASPGCGGRAGESILTVGPGSAGQHGLQVAAHAPDVVPLRNGVHELEAGAGDGNSNHALSSEHAHAQDSRASVQAYALDQYF